MHLLIADPDRSSLMALSRLTSAWGYDPVCVPDGAAALAILSGASSPRLALLAWKMAGAGGVEVCRALRASEAGAGVRYLAVTSEEMGLAELSGALEAGADAVLPSPPEPLRLRATLQAGRRIVELQAALGEREQLCDALRQARALCHDLSQPLQVAGGWAELLLEDLPPGDPNRSALEEIACALEQAGALAQRLQGIARSTTQVNGFNPLGLGGAPASLRH